MCWKQTDHGGVKGCCKIDGRWKKQGEDGDAKFEQGIEGKKVGIGIGVSADKVWTYGNASHKGGSDYADGNDGCAEW